MGNRRESRPAATTRERSDDTPLPGAPVIQRKMIVGDANDSLEREADKVASEVVQRLSSPAVVSAAPVGGTVRRTAQGSAAESFAAPPDVESAISRSRGKGSQLDPATKSQFEGAFGADLSAVRVHTDDSADQLNRAVSAKAFTTGNDVYFSKGTYQPGSREGQHLLAHELTHTMQQTGTAQRSTIQRLSVQNTDFTKTTAITVEQAGSSGKVATFSDGSPNTIVVKAGQDFGNEMVTAASLHGAMGALGSKKGESGGFKGRGPNARLATPQEIGLIKAIAPTMIPTGTERNFITGLDSGQAMISTGMSGEKVNDVVRTTTDPGKTGSIDPDSLIGSLLMQKGPLKVLGQHAVVDVVMGMFDRLINLFNPENFMYDPATKTFNFVDNVKDQDASSLVSKDTNQGGFQSSRGSFNAWTTKPYLTALQGGTLANLLFDNVLGDSGIGYDIRGQAKQQFDDYVRQEKGRLTNVLKAGVKEGQSNLKKILENPMSVVAGINDPVYKREMVTSLLARKYVAIDKVTPAKAWDKAALKANALVPVVQTAAPQGAPQRPANPAPNPPPNGGGGNNPGGGGAPGGRPPVIGGHRVGVGGGGAPRIGAHRR